MDSWFLPRSYSHSTLPGHSGILDVFKYLVKESEVLRMSQGSSRKLQMVRMEETSVKSEVRAGLREITAVLVPPETPKGNKP